MRPALPEISRAELSAVVRAVRVRPSRDKELRAAAVAFSAVLLISLHSASLAAWNPSQAPVGAPEENQMLSLRQIAVVSSLAVSSSVLAQNAVQWRVEDGGNGHWYAWKPQGTFASWSAARDAAAGAGGYLASIRSEAEEAFARTVVGAWTCGLSPESSTAIGGFQPNPTDVSCCWEWVSGEPWTGWEPWTGGAPDNGPSGPESILLMRREAGWNDGNIDYGAYWTCRIAALFEWSADCNNDGIVDFGQIRDGTLIDTNSNNIPDCCESTEGCNPCPADVDGSGAVNGVDLAAILNVWGTSGGKYPGADVNQDGIVDGSDLAEVLNGWGACP